MKIDKNDNGGQEPQEDPMEDVAGLLLGLSSAPNVNLNEQNEIEWKNKVDEQTDDVVINNSIQVVHKGHLKPQAEAEAEVEENLEDSVDEEEENLVSVVKKRRSRLNLRSKRKKEVFSSSESSDNEKVNDAKRTRGLRNNKVKLSRKSSKEEESDDYEEEEEEEDEEIEDGEDGVEEGEVGNEDGNDDVDDDEEEDMDDELSESTVKKQSKYNSILFPSIPRRSYSFSKRKPKSQLLLNARKFVAMKEADVSIVEKQIPSSDSKSKVAAISELEKIRRTAKEETEMSNRYEQKKNETEKKRRRTVILEVNESLKEAALPKNVNALKPVKVKEWGKQVKQEKKTEDDGSMQEASTFTEPSSFSPNSSPSFITSQQQKQPYQQKQQQQQLQKDFQLPPQQSNTPHQKIHSMPKHKQSFNLRSNQGASNDQRFDFGKGSKSKKSTNVSGNQDVIKRPTLKKPVNVSVPFDTSLERLQRESTSQALWIPPDPSQLCALPPNFDSADAYVAAFEPLLFEECRAQLRSVWEEACEGNASNFSLSFPVTVKSLELHDRGWYEAILVSSQSQMNSNWRENDVAVLSSLADNGQKKGGSFKESSKNEGFQNISSAKIAGIARRMSGFNQTKDCFILKFHVSSDELNDNSESCTSMAVKMIEKKEGEWLFTPLGSLTTTQREYAALHSLKKFQPQMLEAILRPRPNLFPEYSIQQPPPLSSVFTPNFTKHMHQTFNPPQLSAIQWAAAHTAASPNLKKVVSEPKPLKTASSAFSLGSETGSEAGSKRLDPSDNDDAHNKSWPFTLVQGPPGTGKTHTVWGMLNVIHLVQFQRYYTSLTTALAPSATVFIAEGMEREGKGLDEMLDSMEENNVRMLPKLAPKPRMLVCAPSNAAVDELLTRVVERGFWDGEMRVYHPDVARVGADTNSRAAQAVSVERRTGNLLNMHAEDARKHLNTLRQKEKHLSMQIMLTQKNLHHHAAMSSKGALGVDPEEISNRDRDRDASLQQLVAMVEERDKLQVEMSRLWLVFSAKEGKISLESAQNQLEASYANEAEIVFTTASSSGRRLFSRLSHGFDMVVIDEAAQASEMSVLCPLSLKTSRCVLVGDPQQLPATVISRVAQSMLYSRSLFERFQQANCPTILLTVQYRMHPSIREFPSRYFYDDRLIDSESIKSKEDEPYYEDPLLRPYLFFDVSRGRESHAGSISYQNSDEAKLALHLFNHLQKVSKEKGALGPVPVGVVTPYKQQLRLLKQEFEKVDVGHALYMNTVDAFQGQERDVIIMSCVRASAKGVGFVADIRRMNVALTRAKRALWVLGNAASLCQSDAWSALVNDAKTRGCFIPRASIESLFPSFPKQNRDYPTLPPPRYGVEPNHASHFRSRVEPRRLGHFPVPPSLGLGVTEPGEVLDMADSFPFGREGGVRRREMIMHGREWQREFSPFEPRREVRRLEAGRNVFDLDEPMRQVVDSDVRLYEPNRMRVDDLFHVNSHAFQDFSIQSMMEHDPRTEARQIRYGQSNGEFMDPVHFFHSSEQRNALEGSDRGRDRDDSMDGWRRNSNEMLMDRESAMERHREQSRSRYVWKRDHDIR